MHPDLGSALVIRGDARALPLADNTVDVVVTSPPYFALRSYTDDGVHYVGQIGDEPTPAEFVDALVAVTAELARVVKPEGSIFVNLGDKYAERGGPERDGGVDGDLINHRAARPRRRSAAEAGVREKSLMMLPARYAIRCTDELRLILRAELIWDKVNGLPESVKDRVRRSHEQWFHFVQRPKYFSAVDHIREAHVSDKPGMAWSERSARGDAGRQVEQRKSFGEGMAADPLGRLPGSVWPVPSEPLKIPPELGVDHFAAFPTAWPKRLISGWCPQGICLECGKGRFPVAESTQETYRDAGSTGRPKQQSLAQQHSGGRNGVGYPQTRSSTVIVGYACACTPRISNRGKRAGAHWTEVAERWATRRRTFNAEPLTPTLPEWSYFFEGWEPAPTRPAVVLDPFGGTGTVALVAKGLGHVGISVDASGDYSRVAAWRVADRNQLAKILDLPKLAAPPTTDLSLF